MANEIEIRVTGQNQSQAAIAAARKDVTGLTTAVTQTGQAYTKAGKEASGFGTALKTTASVTAGVLAADAIKKGAEVAVEQIKSTISAASNLNESVNAVTDVFHQNSSAIEDWGKKNSEAFGLSMRAFNEAATPLGALLKNAGLSEDQVTDQTIKLTMRASDMASVFNKDVTQSLEAIQAGLRGESQPLEQFGVKLTAADVSARALADTGKQSVTALTAQELAMARLNIIYDQTNDTAGDFQNTSTGLANATRIANAAIEDAKANIGAAFLPVLAEAAKLTGVFAGAMASVPGPALAVVAGIAALGAGFVVVAPKIKAAKEALDSAVNSENKFVSAAGKSVGVLGQVAAGFAAVQIIGKVVGDQVFGSAATSNVEAAANSLQMWNKQAILAGEGAAEFGANAEDLTRALQTAAGDAGDLGGWNKWTNKIDRVSTSALGLGGDFDKLDATTKNFDTTLAYMAQNGHATDTLNIIAKAASNAGLSVDQLKALLPLYSAAMQVAASKTGKVGDAATAASVDVLQLADSIHATVNAEFALESSEDKLANDMARLVDQIKAQKAAHDAGAGSLDRNTQAGRDNAAVVRQLLNDVADLGVQYAQAGKPVDGLRKSFEDQLKAMGFSQAQIKEYTDSLDHMIASLSTIPPIVVTDVYVRQHDGAVSLGYAHGNASGGIGGGSFPYAASGGLPRQGGTPTVMNEQGNELVHLPWGATVYSAGQSRSMVERGDMLDGRGPGGGGRGGGDVVIRGDGSPIAEALIRILQMAISAKGGRPDILGLRIAT